MQPPTSWRSLPALLVLVALFAPGPRLGASQSIEFNRDIRPILSDKCFSCHGPDRNSRKAELRLDLEREAKSDRDGKRIIAPGNPDQSEVVRRITTTDPEDRMPPAKSGKSLTRSEIALIRAWIEQGAPWQGHWAFIPPSRPAPPPVKNTSWPQRPIDDFILARLERAGLAPSPEADKRTLIRRLTLDLIGLPPKPAEVEVFIKDDRPEAYGELVDRLLASPHYGERMAMHWLDLVRYADTVGYHGDQDVSLWPFRDYVIKAFNNNLPFDRFTIEQLAGDLLPDATQEQKVASGYNRLNMITAEGGAQDKEYLAKYAADRVRTTSAIWLGATLGCAECHDHKFDPYTTRDFYSFGAFFADLKEKGYYNGAKWEPEMQVPNSRQAKAKNRLSEIIAGLETTLKTPTEQLVHGQRQWERHLRAEDEAEQLGWTPVRPERVESENGSTLTLQDDDSILASGENPENDTYTVRLKTDREELTAIRLEALTDDSMDKQSLSRGGGNFVLTGFEVERVDGDSTRAVEMERAIASYEQKNFPVSAAIDDDPKSGWAVDGHEKHENRKAAFLFKHKLRGGPGTELIVRLKHESKEKHHNIGRFRLSIIAVERPTLDRYGFKEEYVQILRIPERDRSEEQSAKLAEFYRSVSPHLDGARQELADTKSRLDRLNNEIPTMLVSMSTEPRTMRVLARGNWMDDSGDIVQPAWPAFLGQPRSDARPTRLDLARWLVSEENPLAARAFVNRLWKIYFGAGLSKVLDDLGAQGESPTHPDLIDWLAVEFRDSGWDIKHLIKLIVTSSAYKQSSATTPELRERDPYNRLLARQSRFRLNAETVRDNALAVSGLLETKLGGPSVKPYQPAGYYSQLNFPKRTYKSDAGENQYRRGVYTHWQRTFLHPSMVAFDAPSREECTAERARSNTPLQALALLNDPSYVEAARVFAARILEEGGATTDDRLRWAWQQALSRLPVDEELATLRGLVRNHLQHFRTHPAEAEQLVSVGNSPLPVDTELPLLAAWTSVARAVLNLHETITRY